MDKRLKILLIGFAIGAYLRHSHVLSKHDKNFSTIADILNHQEDGIIIANKHFLSVTDLFSSFIDDMYQKEIDEEFARIVDEEDHG